jgi:tetratricopeptide (TPR) repeat protein
MKFGLLIMIAAAVLVNDPLRTGKINRAKSRAKEAINNGNFQDAIKEYRYLIDSMGVQEPALNLNLAHAYYLAKDTSNVVAAYQAAASGDDRNVSSIANQQLGLIYNSNKKPEEALSYFKQAIKADPRNEDARYNYEMLKKKLEKKKKEDEQKKKDQDKNQDQKQEPSEYAKKLKAQADRLVQLKEYQQAYDLMTEGLKKDQTVSAYNDYINRLKIVSQINK